MREDFRIQFENGIKDASRKPELIQTKNKNLKENEPERCRLPSILKRTESLKVEDMQFEDINMQVNKPITLIINNLYLRNIEVMHIIRLKCHSW